MSAARTYELVYIVTPDATEEQIAAIHEQVEQTTKKMGGSLVKTDNWGRRKLAYAIQHHKEGVYILETIEGSGDTGADGATIKDAPASGNSPRSAKFSR